jgi:hypothetical protein
MYRNRRTWVAYYLAKDVCEAQSVFAAADDATDTGVNTDAGAGANADADADADADAQGPGPGPRPGPPQARAQGPAQAQAQAQAPRPRRDKVDLLKIQDERREARRQRNGEAIACILWMSSTSAVRKDQ